MWIVFAFGSAFFAGITAILAKVGVKSVNSNLVTALRTVVVLLFSWLMVFIVGSQVGISSINGRTLLFLVLSGLATGASWICYYRALQLGDVNKVAPIDKSSTVLTMMLAFIILGDAVTVPKIVGMVLILIGTMLMISPKPGERSASPRYCPSGNSRFHARLEERKEGKRGWLLWAVGSAVFASLTSILGKIGIENVESNLGTAIRTGVVLVMAWLIVLARGEQKGIKNIDKKSWLFIVLSGFATGASWLCYYRALQLAEASVVAPIDKLSILVTILFSYIFLKEKLSKIALVGLILLTAGTFALLIKI